MSGADQAHFTTGRGTCLSYTTSDSSGDMTKTFTLQLQVPADKPRYRLEITIFRYGGPGSGASTADTLPAGYDGPVIKGDIYVLPPVAGTAATEFAVRVSSDGVSGSMIARFPDRTLTGTWRCTARQVGRPL